MERQYFAICSIYSLSLKWSCSVGLSTFLVTTFPWLIVPLNGSAAAFCVGLFFGEWDQIFFMWDYPKTCRMFNVTSFAFQMPVLPPAIVTTTRSNTFTVGVVPPLAEKNLLTRLYDKWKYTRNVNKLFSQDFFLDRDFGLFLVREVGNRFEEPWTLF